MQQSVTHTTFSNGLQVMLKEIHTAPIISNWVLVPGWLKR